MDYTIVKQKPGQWVLFAEVAGSKLAVKLNTYNSRGGAYATACLLLGRNLGSITVMSADLWAERQAKINTHRRAA